MRYVILNDGETHTGIQGCVIYDSTTNKMYSISIDRELSNDEMHWEKGIEEIRRNETNLREDFYSATEHKEPSNG